MSLLRIHHRTCYRYSKPVAFGRHRLVIRPREGHDIHIIHHDLQINPKHTLKWRRDIFGNSVALVDFENPAEELEISSEILLQHAGLDFHIPEKTPLELNPFQDYDRVNWPVTYPEMERTIAEAYLESIYPEEAEKICEWIKNLPFHPESEAYLARATPESRPLSEFVLGLNRWIYQNIQYRRREEKGVQSPLQTLELASGSCRDMATLMLEALRQARVAARFSSGYLDGQAASQGTAATHAWIECHVPDQGWVGFDPSLGEPTTRKHITTGVSAHPRGVMPVSGSYIPNESLYLGMSVNVHITHLENKNCIPTHMPSPYLNSPPC